MKKLVSFLQGSGITWRNVIETEHRIRRHLEVAVDNNPCTLTREQKIMVDQRLRSITWTENHGGPVVEKHSSPIRLWLESLCRDATYIKSITYKWVCFLSYWSPPTHPTKYKHTCFVWVGKGLVCERSRFHSRGVAPLFGCQFEMRLKVWNRDRKGR